MSDGKAGSGLWYLVCFFAAIALLGGDGHDHTDLEKRVSRLEQQLAEVAQAGSSIEDPMSLLANEDLRIKASALEQIGSIVRRFPEKRAPEARYRIAGYIRERLESGGSSEDADVRLAMEALLGLEGRHIRSKIVGSGTAALIDYEVDFSGLDLRGFDFSRKIVTGFSFAQADLRGVDLTLGTFSDCSFEGANLQEADLAAAVFPDSEFAGADMSKARLWGATFLRASFSGTALTAADLQGSKFDGVDLSGAQGLTAEQLALACLHPSVDLGEYSSWYPAVPNSCPHHFRER